MKYLIKGKLYDPIKVGDPGDWMQEPNSTCHDCGEGQGQYHHEGCDVERCPCCGGQLISCDCGAIYTVDEKMSQEEIQELCKLQEIQTEADKLEIDNLIKKKEIHYDSSGPEGNIYFILAKVKLAFEREGKLAEFEELANRVYSSGSYEEAIQIINEYVSLIDTKPKSEVEYA